MAINTPFSRTATRHQIAQSSSVRHARFAPISFKLFQSTVHMNECIRFHFQEAAHACT